jgi:hypothetical protein
MGGIAVADYLGLRRSKERRVRKIRRLPVKGEILVKQGERVLPTTTIARTIVAGKSESINLMRKDGTSLYENLTKKIGERVKRGDIIATRTIKGFFGRTEEDKCISPIDGVIDFVIHNPPIISMVVIRERIQLEVKAFISGYVTDIVENGAIIETLGTHIQGIFGVGGETYGELNVKNDYELTSEDIDDDCFGKILVGGNVVTIEGLRKARKVGVKGIVVGGIDRIDLDKLLGYELGVAVTGYEDLGFTLIITEAFGKVRMLDETLSLLKRANGRFACISGATQVRSGVVRPEIIIPKIEFSLDKLTKTDQKRKIVIKELKLGTPIRVIQEPYFELGKVVSLPVGLHKLETETWVRVLDVKLNDGRTIKIPRTNVEIL